VRLLRQGQIHRDAPFQGGHSHLQRHLVVPGVGGEQLKARAAATTTTVTKSPQAKRLGVGCGGGGGLFAWPRFFARCPRCRRAGRAADALQVHTGKPVVVAAVSRRASS
jgi:hypothetical protein